MATAILPQYITVAEFDRMEFADERDYDLLDGEVVEVSHPSLEHFAAAEHIAELLRRVVPRHILVGREVPYVIEPGTKRRADVGAVDRSRLSRARVSRRLDGAPELVIEIISPSNLTRRDMRTALLCLSNGAHQFWLVDTVDRRVLVLSGGDKFNSYEAGSRIPLPEALGGGEIALDEIFASADAAEAPLS